MNRITATPLAWRASRDAARKNWISRIALSCCVLSILAAPAGALLINIDIDPRNDGAHSGDDGALSSTGGTTWNHVGLDFLNDVHVDNLSTEFGVRTVVDVTFDANGSIDANARAIELYDGGGTGILEIESLSPTTTWDLVIYAHDPSFSVSVTDASGTSSQSTGPTFSVELPGSPGERFLVFSGLVPVDLGGGVFGLTVQTTGPVRMAGLQLMLVPEPHTAALLAAGLLALALRSRSV